ncbi:hypothetical protein LOTGIDRAFT_239158 [Lottia gigantea]|uniref:Vitelline envelope sperm lysin receptor C-terminal domain-containing protein n=1 Tax=Lottia gigantea TaxID=225164 RepID=V4AJD9_LOTGI|nr:hypothetical protein LOTGIDRAFT_239158 [Lottia gigantea]ESO97217.1 hypothetical protein LOTGIDRAFT_239158 [Lottia gigantea]
MSVVVVFVFLLLATVSAVEPPTGYILDVSIDCGSSVSDSPVIKILSDLDIKAEAHCVGESFKFTTDDNVHHEVTASYTVEGANSNCILRNTKNTHEADVHVLFGTTGGHILTKTQVFTVSCTLDSNGIVSATNLNTQLGRIAHKELVTNVGTSILAGKITLELQDVKEQKITGDTPMDKWVSLYAVSDGTMSETGLKALSCYAKNSNGDEYGILRSGCGDGLVFPKDAGFKTVGKTVRSPYFKSFLVEGDATITYECEYLLCTSECNGSSCDNTVVPPK